ncbi:hypothetical protein STEG23_020991 [Scotinomys teguina]
MAWGRSKETYSSTVVVQTQSSNNNEFNDLHSFWVLYIAVFYTDIDWIEPKPNTDCVIKILTPDTQEPKISGLFSHHQRSFLLQEMGTNTETHSQTVWRE